MAGGSPGALAVTLIAPAAPPAEEMGPLEARGRVFDGGVLTGLLLHVLVGMSSKGSDWNRMRDVGGQKGPAGMARPAVQTLSTVREPQVQASEETKGPAAALL